MQPAQAIPQQGFINLEVIEYNAPSNICRTIVQKAANNVTVVMEEAYGQPADNVSPSDTFVQVVEGSAEVSINGKVYQLRLGEGIIIPAHTTHHFRNSRQFKLISTCLEHSSDRVMAFSACE